MHNEYVCPMVFTKYSNAKGYAIIHFKRKCKGYVPENILNEYDFNMFVMTADEYLDFYDYDLELPVDVLRLKISDKNKIKDLCFYFNNEDWYLHPETNPWD